MKRLTLTTPMVLGALVLTAIATFVVAYVLVHMFENKQAARVPFVRVVEVNEVSTDPEPWALNWPSHYDTWKATAGDSFYGGSSAMPASKLDEHPWLKRLYAGYAFSIDYREARGHAYMLYDQGVTERVHQAKQPGACLHCHAANTVLYRKVGLEAQGKPATPEILAASFDMPAVIRGFEELSKKPYEEVYAQLRAMPDGTPDEDKPVFPEAPEGGFKSGQSERQAHDGEAHPVSCIDCHDPSTMRIRVTRPGFMKGIAALAASKDDVPHLPSIERWRRGDRSLPYDPNRDATRQEMRSFVCGQCHVEYYCGAKETLTFPWDNGLEVEQIETTWNSKKFADGTPFYDYTHGETGAHVLKAQHPEFEMWSQGVHARSGVACADCHMPYQRVGAMKMSNHTVRSPLETISTSCQQCHPRDEGELRDKVHTIQARTIEMRERAATAMTDMLDAILEAKAARADEKQLEEIYALQRAAMWRLDFVSSENSRGFHADQEAVRVLGESIDYSRRAQAAALRLRAPAAPSTEALPKEAVKGVTDRQAPSDAPKR